MKQNSRRRMIAFAVVAMMLSGCGNGQSKWEINVEHQGTAPCSVYVTMDRAGGGAQDNSEAKFEKMAAGEKLTLIADDIVQSIRSVKVVRGEDEQILERRAKTRPNRRYQIVVTDDGNVEATFAE